MPSLSDLFASIGAGGGTGSTQGFINPNLRAPSLSTEGLNIFDPVPETRTSSLVNTIMGNQTIGGNTFGVRDHNTRDYGNIADPTLNAMMNTAGHGRARSGVQAFLGDNYNLTQQAQGSDDPTNLTYNTQPLLNLAQQTGFDTSRYTLDPSQQRINGQRNASGIEALYADLNNQLKDYASIQGISNWQGRSDPRAATHTIYRREGDRLNAVSPTMEYRQRETGGGLLQDPEFMAAMSVAMPAFGGWGGILGQGTAGTLTAGSGLGLTTGLGSVVGGGAANAITNAAMNAALGGGGGRGFLGSLAGSALGAAGQSLTGGSGGLGSMFDTSTAGVSQLNPMGYYNSALRGTGNPLGQLTGLIGAGRGLANLYNRG